MRFDRILLLVFIGLCGGWLSAFTKEVRDTIKSSSKDLVYVEYNIRESNGKVTISFSEVRKRLGLDHQSKYDLKKVCVLYFDKGGGYKDKFTGNITTHPLYVSSDKFRYHFSDEGYVRLEDGAEIQLDLLAESATLSLPVCLANYEGKHRYKVFAQCGNLDIVLKKKKKQEASVVRTQESVQREIPVTEQVEVDTDMPPAQEAELLIENLGERLRQGLLSLSELESMSRNIDKLRDLEITIPDKALQGKIRGILQDYDSQCQAAKQQQEQEEKTEMAVAQQQEKEQQIKEKLAYVRERLDSIDKLSDNDLVDLKNASIELRREAHGIDNSELAQQMKDTAAKCDAELKKIEDGKKKRNILLIVLGILLGILLFVGNQLMQHFRNLRNMKSMEDAQNKIAKRAEDEAKRRAHAAIRSKISTAQGKARQKQNEAVRGMEKSVAKGIKNNIKKDLSI